MPDYVCGSAATLEASGGVCENPTPEDLDAFVRNMIGDASDFVTLTPADSIKGIRYIQAARTEKGISLQLGLENEGRIRLVEKICGEEETLAFFRSFFDGNARINLNEYHPLHF